MNDSVNPGTNQSAVGRRNFLTGLVVSTAAAGMTSQEAVAAVAQEYKRTPQQILHVRVGDPESWDPTPEEMEQVRDLFLDAVNHVVQGAKGPPVLVTRHDVVVDVIRLDASHDEA